jgi:cytochrome b-561
MYVVDMLQLHPVLMLIGYIILGSEGKLIIFKFSSHDKIFQFCNITCMLAAIMIYKVLPTWKHDTTKQIHLVLHAIALVLGAFGIYCAFKFHNESGIANLYSLHSWLGIGTICLYGIQVILYTWLHIPFMAIYNRLLHLSWIGIFSDKEHFIKTQQVASVRNRTLTLIEREDDTRS